MRAKFSAALGRFDALSLRERLLILTTGMVTLVLPLFLYGIEPAQKSHAALTGKVLALQTEVANKTLERVTLASNPKLDPDIALRERIAALEIRRDTLNATLDERAARLISPREMLSVLQAALAEHPGLALVRAEKGEAGRFDGGAGNEALAGVYRHDLTLVVAGGYFEVLEYLKALEQLPRGFFWDGIDYEVKAHPRAQVTLRLHTLSTEAGWLGV